MMPYFIIYDKKKLCKTFFKAVLLTVFGFIHLLLRIFLYRLPSIRVGKITCFALITITTIQEEILKTLRPIHLQKKPRVLLMSTLWICFAFPY